MYFFMYFMISLSINENHDIMLISINNMQIHDEILQINRNYHFCDNFVPDTYTTATSKLCHFEQNDAKCDFRDFVIFEN